MPKNSKGKAKAAAPKQQISATPTPIENEQERSIRNLPWGNVVSFFGRYDTRRSTNAPIPTSPVNVTRSDITSNPPVPPEPKSHEKRDAEGSRTTAKAPNDPNSGPLKLGELLQQEASDVWIKAFNDLPSEYKQGLEYNTDCDKSEKLEALLELAMKAKRKNLASQWTFKWGGKEINVREKAEKLVGWIEKFKEVVNIAVQCDPVHAGLPWAGVTFILTACPSQFTKAYSKSLCTPVVNY